MERKYIPVIIPAYEPNENLIKLIDDLVQLDVKDIIVINDGSNKEYDRYFEEVAKYSICTVLKHFANMGKGRALKTAFNYCLNTYGEALLGCVTADSDGQHTPKDIKKCIDSLEENRNDLILGCRDFNGDDVPAKSKYGNKITCKVCKWLCGMDISDTQTGLRAIPKEFMAELLNVSGERFEFETNMLIESKGKYPIREIIIDTIYDSKENHQTHFHPIRDSIKIYKIFGRSFFRFLISSLSSSVVDILLFAVFCDILEGMSGVLYVAYATVAARVISAIYNYIINYKYVFKSSENVIKAGIRYWGLVVIQMLTSAVLVSVGVMVFSKIPEVIVKGVVDVGLFFISYYIQHEYIFKK